MTIGTNTRAISNAELLKSRDIILDILREEDACAEEVAFGKWKAT
jgi:hypothetical protein